MTSADRGERNNNPGNIRHNGIAWAGMCAKQTDDEFIQFVTPLYGIRAIALILFNYQRLHGLSTVHDIIDRWAPPSENDTGAYVLDVANRLGVSINTPIKLDHQVTLSELVKAIIIHENGRCIYDDATITKAVLMII